MWCSLFHRPMIRRGARQALDVYRYDIWHRAGNIALAAWVSTPPSLHLLLHGNGKQWGSKGFPKHGAYIWASLCQHYLHVTLSNFKKKKDKQCRQIRHADVNLQLLKYELCKTKCRVMKSFFSHKHKLKISALIEMLASFSFVQIEHGKYKYRTAVISGGCSPWL